MARHRVGNTYLSEEEYDKHNNKFWGIIFFFIGAVITGLFVNIFAINHGWIKILRFLAVLSSGLFVGGLLAYFNKLVQGIIFLFLISGIVYSVGKFVWKII